MTLIKALKLSIIKKIFSAFLIIGSLFWMVWIIQSDITSHGWKEILPNSFLWLVIALFIGVSSQFINLLVFLKFLRADKANYNFLQIAKLFFTGQIIRYIPGRVWGILYQVVNTPVSIPRKNIIVANIELMFVAFSGLITTSMSIIFYHYNYLYLSIAFFMTGYSFIGLVLLKGWLSVFLNIIHWVTKNNNYRINIQPIKLQTVLSVLAMSVLTWVTFFLGWLSIEKAGYDSQTSSLIILAAIYSISWFIGYVSMISPSGLGVREASFLFLSQGLASSGELAIIAIIARIWLLFIDLSLFLIFIGFTNKNKTNINKGFPTIFKS